MLRPSSRTNGRRRGSALSLAVAMAVGTGTVHASVQEVPTAQASAAQVPTAQASAAQDPTAQASAARADVGPPPTIQNTSAMDPAVVTLLAELVAEVVANPTAADARAELGLAYEGNTIWSLAETCYDQALLLVPDETQWRFRRGVVRFKNGDLEGAIDDMRATATVFKNTPVVQARLGDALRIAGELEESEAAWRNAIAAEEKQPQVVRYAASRVGLAQVLLDLERPEESEQLCREALELSPGYRHAHYTLGLALLDLGKDEEGEIELAAGETAYPEFPPGPHAQKLLGYGRGFSRSMMLIENLVQIGNLPEAAARLEKILETRGDDQMVLNLAARVAMRSGDVDRARTLLTQSLGVAPGEPATLLEMCLLELEQANQAAMQVGSLQQAIQAGQPVNQAQVDEARARGAALAARALEFASQAVQAAPAVGRYHYWLGVCHQSGANFAADQNAMGQSLQAALGSYQMALRLGCTEPSFNQQLSSLYGQMGRPRDMLRFALRDLETRPNDPNALGQVVQGYFSNERPDEILPYVRRMEAVATGNAQLLQFCVQAYLTVGELDAAERVLGDFEAAAAGNPQAAQFLTAARAFILTERAKKTPAEGPPAAGGGGGGDSTSGGKS